jgi:3-oxoacyl-[acyl-carrier-protein] synthase-3
MTVLGLGAALPDHVVTNDDWAAVLDTSDEWITSRTGIRRRHLVTDGVHTSDLAAAAGAQAIADAGGVRPVAVLVATTTPDHRLPGTAPVVASKLGLGPVPAFDLQAACSGFLYGLPVAATWAAAARGPVLLIGAEAISRAVDRTDRTTAVLFGDGAGAVVVNAEGPGTFGPTVLGSDGELAEALWVPAGGTKVPATPEQLERHDHELQMNGATVYREAVSKMTAASAQVLKLAGLTVDDVDLLVAHQANRRILDAVTSRLGMPDERCVVTVDRHGNTSAASIPLALAETRAAGGLRPGATVLLTAFGGGFTWGAGLLTWGGRATDPTPIALV